MVIAMAGDLHKVMDLLYICNDLARYNKGISIMYLFANYPKEG